MGFVQISGAQVHARCHGSASVWLSERCWPRCSRTCTAPPWAFLAITVLPRGNPGGQVEREPMLLFQVAWARPGCPSYWLRAAPDQVAKGGGVEGNQGYNLKHQSRRGREGTYIRASCLACSLLHLQPSTEPSTQKALNKYWLIGWMIGWIDRRKDRWKDG